MEQENPVSKILSWKGGEDNKGMWKVYDRVEKQASTIKSAIKIAIIDQKNTVAGWIDDKQVTANEVSNLKKEELSVVKWSGGEAQDLIKGYYSEIKDTLKAKGIKFRKVAYGLVTEGSDEIVGDLVRLDLEGCANGAWINASIKTGQGVSFEEDGNFKKIGSIKFYEPKIDKFEIEPDDLQACKIMLEELNAFRDSFNKEEETEEVPF
jgi:hypothetical protein